MGIFPDTILALWFQAESYTETEGGPWLPCLGREMITCRIHALRMTNGEIWDVINGWRNAERYRNFEQESREEYDRKVDEHDS